MANLIRLDTHEYPVSTTEFFARHKQTSFPAQFSKWEEFGYAVVFPAPTPAYDPITQYVREIAPEKTAKGHWEQRFEVLDLDTETIAANQARQVEQNNTRIKAEIAVLDLKRIRPLAEGDTAFLDNLNAQTILLRKQLQK